MAHLRIGEAVSRPRGESVRVPVIRTPGGLVKRLGRAVLWLLVLVLLLRGLASVLAPREPAVVVQSHRSTATAWPDDYARAFAAEFARAYLTYSPKRPDAAARAVQAFAVPELAVSIAPEYDANAPAQTVGSVTVARATTLDARHALVTVAATLDGAAATRYLTVPVERDEAGGLVVSDLPSFAAAPARASVDTSATEPVTLGIVLLMEPVAAAAGASTTSQDGEPSRSRPASWPRQRCRRLVVERLAARVVADAEAPRASVLVSKS